MKDKKFIEIKNRIQKKCLEIWGIDDLSMADPLVMMLLDVLIYEIYFLNQEIIDSDSKIIERVAQEMIPSHWNFPMPAHALASAKTVSGLVTINEETEFSVKNNLSSNTNSAIYFTPFTQEKIVEGAIKFQYHSNYLSYDNQIEVLDTSFKISDYKVWIGLDCNLEFLEKLEFLKFTFLTENSKLDDYLKFVIVKDALGNIIDLESENFAEIEDNKHYTENIKNYYKNYIFKIKLQTQTLVYKDILHQFNIKKEDTNCDDANLELVWFEFTFPEIFTKEELDKITIKINTFPVVNRKQNQRVHQFKNEGRLFSMKGTKYSHFLDVHKISDEKNNTFSNSLKDPLEFTKKESYTLFYGGLENYDPRNAKFFLKKLTRVLREDISAFSSINADYIDSTMARINEEINKIEQKINISFSDINEKEDVFALVNTSENTEMLYCSYWTSEGDLANNFRKGTALKQAVLSELIQDSTVLETTSLGGVYRNNKTEKLINMRYGFLSKERLVTTQDIKAAVQFYLRNSTKEITIKDGVGISTNKKKGLFRTIDVFISLQNNKLLDANSKQKMEFFLKETLEKQSVINIPFQITIH